MPSCRGVVRDEEGRTTTREDWRTVFDEAEQRRRYSTTPRRRYVSSCTGDDFTFAGMESEMKKIQAKMCEWCDVKVRGILGGGIQDVHETGFLGRNLTWTEEAWRTKAARGMTKDGRDGRKDEASVQ